MPGLGQYALAGLVAGTGQGLVEWRQQQLREAEILRERQWKLEDEARADAKKAKASRGSGGSSSAKVKPLSSTERKEIESKIEQMTQAGKTRDQALRDLANDPLYAPMMKRSLPDVYNGRQEPTPMIDGPAGLGAENDDAGGMLGGLASVLRPGKGRDMNDNSADIELPSLDDPDINDAVTGGLQGALGIDENTGSPQLNIGGPVAPTNSGSADLQSKGLAPEPEVQRQSPKQLTATKPIPAGHTKDSILAEARAALANNKSRSHIEQMLIEWGIDPKEL